MDWGRRYHSMYRRIHSTTPNMVGNNARGELMSKNPIYERVPPIVVFGILMCAASIIALILTW